MSRFASLAILFNILAMHVLADTERSADVERTIDSVRAEIRNDQAHPWAGEYRGHLGIDTFTTLYVAPDAGIAYHAHGNSGVYERNAGSIDVDEGKISITWRHPEDYPRVPTIERELLIVPWNDIVFLVPQCAIHRFCLDAKQNPNRLLSSELVRNNAGIEKLSGKPSLPKELKIFWDLPEINASVVSTSKPQIEQVSDETKQATQAVTLDKGVADHIYVGMRLECERITRRFTVTSTDQDSCTAISIVTAKRNSPIRPIRRGWTLNTSTW